MARNFEEPAQVQWHADEHAAPGGWLSATAFPTLREALHAIVNGSPQTGHPWVQCGGTVYAPHEVEDLWREDRMR